MNLRSPLLFVLVSCAFVVVASAGHANVCWDGILEGGELCDLQPNTGGGVQFDNNLDCTDFARDSGTLRCTQDCLWDWSGCYNGGVQLCGNSLIEPGEMCDAPGTGFCSDDCKCLAAPVASAVCGNGCTDAGEECDDGNTSEADRCRNNCDWVRICGNGRLEPGEECDAGGLNSDTLRDACRTSCELPSCGDDVWDTGEACDDGPQNSDLVPDACRTSCLLPSCGDEVADPVSGEECDLGMYNSDQLGSSCTTLCQIPRCGNGYPEAGEVCDDENNDAGDGCSADCHSDESCGNGIVDILVGESCDDDATAGGDGCSATCRVEVGWICVGQPSVCALESPGDAGTPAGDAGAVDSGDLDAGAPDRSATDATGPVADASAASDRAVGQDAASDPEPAGDGGCGCRGSSPERRSAVTLLAILCVFPLAWRRRRAAA